MRAPAPPPPPSKRVLCPKCSYDVSGIIGDRCPECGANLLLAMSSVSRRAQAAKQYRASLIAPLLMLVIGVGGATLVYGLTGGWIYALALDVFLAIKIVVALVVFWVMSLVWFGMNEHPLALLLKVAGIYASLEFADSLFDLVPLLNGFVSWFILLLAYLGLLCKMLDLEPVEAIGVAFATFMARTLLIVYVAAIFF